MGAVLATPEILREFSSALIDTSLPPAQVASELFTISNLVERRHPDAMNRYGRTLLKAGYTRDETDSLVQRFSVAMLAQKALVASMNEAAFGVCQDHGICSLCLGRDRYCPECQDVSVNRADDEAEALWAA